jgi:mono/diheme cytochrome c family protein
MPRPKNNAPLVRFRRRSPFILLLLLLIWSLSIGWALSQAAQGQTPTIPHTGTVDPTPPRYQLGEKLYVENCGTCHIPIPPAVLPSSTWGDILVDEEHYSTQIEVLPSPQIQIAWNYLQTFSRPTVAGEETPYRVESSRYFHALHPNVELERPVTIQGCATCHVNAQQFDFRT